MAKVTRVPVPVVPAPQEFIYVIELEEAQAHFLREMLRNHLASATAYEIIEGLDKAGLGRS